MIEFNSIGDFELENSVQISAWLESVLIDEKKNYCTLATYFLHGFVIVKVWPCLAVSIDPEVSVEPLALATPGVLEDIPGF